MNRIGIVINGKMHFVSIKLGSRLSSVEDKGDGKKEITELGYVAWIGSDKPWAQVTKGEAPDLG